MSRQLPDDPADDDAPSAREIVSSILESGDFSRLVEVFYFSREPGFLEAVRWLASLSDDARRQLGEFAQATDKQTIHIERPDPVTFVMKLIRR